MLNRILSPGFIFFSVTSLITIFSSCSLTKKNANKYINNDSTAVFSTNPSRPFKYGYPLSKEICQTDFRDYLVNYDFHPHEVVAEVGAASGWIMGVLSVSLDSVTFYVEDIDTVLLNNYQFTKMVEHFTKVRDSQQTNQFFYVLGTTKKTNLPDGKFDKIILNNTFHEIRDFDSVIIDIGKKLKPSGKLIIHESFSNDYRIVRHGGCNIKAYKVSQIENWFWDLGFYLTEMSDPINSFENYLVFEQNKEKSDAFKIKIKNVGNHIKFLDQLNLKEISKDSLLTTKMGNYLKENLNQIKTIYPALENYINELGDEWLKQKQFASAINVYRINTILYPDSSSTYENLGDAFMDAKKFNAAIDAYSTAILLKSDPEIINERGNAHFELKNYVEAIEDYSLALKIAKTNLDNYYGNIAMSYSELLEYDSAIEYYSKAIKINPKNPEHYVDRGVAKTDSEQYEEAIKDFTTAIAKDENYVEAYYERSYAKRLMGDKIGAKADRQKSKEVRKVVRKNRN